MRLHPKFINFFLAAACFSVSQAATLPYGTQIEVRLLHQVGSRFSRLGDPVQADVITPVYVKDMLLVPAGSVISGVIEHVDRLGLGLRHVTARLDLHFTRLGLKDGQIIPIDARVASVETARESVRTDGVILGINPTANFSTGVSALFTLSNLAEREFRLPILGFKFLAARSPDAEISFGAGTEMLLRVIRNTEFAAPANRESSIQLLPASQIATVQTTLAALPAQQTDRGRNHPSDLVNILIIGSRDEVNRAFRASGWSAPESHGVMALYHMFHCAVERKGFRYLPMSNLKLNGSSPDAAFEKGLNTFAKRHHIRLWRDPASDSWLAAATEDVSYKMQKGHLTHATDADIDNERAKIVNDLAFTGCVDKGALIPRASLQPARQFGSSVVTDGDIAVLQLNNCLAPRAMPTDPPKPVPVRAIRVGVAVAEDIARSNPFSVGLALTSSLLNNAKIRDNARLQATRTYKRPSAVLGVTAAPADGSLAAR